MESGATKDWREVMKEATGEEMNAKAFVWRLASKKQHHKSCVCVSGI